MSTGKMPICRIPDLRDVSLAELFQDPVVTAGVYGIVSIGEDPESASAGSDSPKSFYAFNSDVGGGD